MLVYFSVSFLLPITQWLDRPAGTPLTYIYTQSKIMECSFIFHDTICAIINLVVFFYFDFIMKFLHFGCIRDRRSSYLFHKIISYKYIL